MKLYGTVNELNSVLGICRSLKAPKRIDTVLESIQNQLFNLGADLATQISKKDSFSFRIKFDDIKFLEISIDKLLETTNPHTSSIVNDALIGIENITGNKGLQY